ncbi:MAG: ATP-dependent Clp protease adaptor ClpS [Bacteroidales bacterium]|nr:ATP-dependent Clp protease adaptor ClpS [Bacteroidales bacterium]
MAKEQTKSRRQSRTRDKEPSRYVVIMHNDDVTTMEFVVEVLINIFFKQPDEAHNLMMEIHNTGSAAVGVYSYDIAVSKATKTMRIASNNNFPLKVTWQEE